MNARVIDGERELELILNEDGSAELIDFSDDSTVWASDSDDDFREEFRELLGEGDVEHIQDYLIDHGVITAVEADNMEVSVDEGEDGPGDEDDEDDEETEEGWDDAT